MLSVAQTNPTSLTCALPTVDVAPAPISTEAGDIRMASKKKTEEVDRGQVAEDADTSLALGDQSNQDAAEQVDDPNATHPLPTDISNEGRDSTGGNAPFAPADITPAGDDHDADDNTGQTGDEHGTGRRED